MEAGSMLTIRRAADRGHLQHAGIDSFHSFSFADYFEPARMGFRCLCALNEESYASGGAGHAPHPHRNMEMLLYVVEGRLRHEDDVDGGERVLRAGDVQGLSAGRGLVHREFNTDPERPCRVFEAWFEPDRNDLEPTCQYCHPDARDGGKGFVLLASPDGRDGTVALRQDVLVYSARFAEGQRVRYFLEAGRAAWIQVIEGEMLLNRRALYAGDGASVEKLRRLDFSALRDTEVLLFDMP
jgi:redox-sensitive bicupin YhaK (pirin superfamily)